MPISLALSVLVAIAGFGYFAWINLGVRAIERTEYISVALSFFNVSIITCLLVTLFLIRSVNDKDYGSAIRENIATVVVALMINLVMSFVDVLDTLM